MGGMCDDDSDDPEVAASAAFVAANRDEHGMQGEAAGGWRRSLLPRGAQSARHFLLPLFTARRNTRDQPDGCEKAQQRAGKEEGSTVSSWVVNPAASPVLAHRRHSLHSVCLDFSQTYLC
jgi:hypothetical protein